MGNAADFLLEDDVLVKYTGTDAVVEIPAGVTTVGNNAFIGNKTMTDLIMPDSLTTIGDHAFERCAKLKELTLPASMKEIKFHSFWMCAALKKLECAAEELEIDPKAFDGCDLLADANGMLILANTL